MLNLSDEVSLDIISVIDSWLWGIIVCSDWEGLCVLLLDDLISKHGEKRLTIYRGWLLNATLPQTLISCDRLTWNHREKKKSKQHFWGSDLRLMAFIISTCHLLHKMEAGFDSSFCAWGLCVPSGGKCQELPHLMQYLNNLSK